MSHSNRIKTLREILIEQKLDGFLVTRLINVRYLTGFSGSNGICLITNSDAFFMSDNRYEQQAKDEVKEFSIHIGRGSLFDLIQELNINVSSQFGFESDTLTYNQFEKISKLYPNIKWRPYERVIENLSIVKSQEEIGYIRKAAEMADRIFSDLVGLIHAGMRENEVAGEIIGRIKRMGGDRSAFEPIVASGLRSVLPHGIASEKLIEQGDLVVLDFGCVVNGYASDITRTIVIGNPSQEQVKIYNIVREAQAQALRSVKAGVKCNELDAAARELIKNAGYGEYFGHALGHGLGLDVHSEPRIATEIDHAIPEYAVITIEPGIYVPELGGVRIEDDVLVRKNHGELLTHATRDFIEIS